ncbi:MAG: DUF2066 domain-containing protein [Oceanicaulis sp.]|uniref:DUF2066 domain-containing protein n=1 Tax=Glycocaulis sp. TaxID=1969725 RepID=UPI0025C24B10|nr:DUF2066 domain-containing protein [Glycocaulis sp.]MCC5981227.1 DUF2066 domain-containing protein [Oceanicaulis sp.]MCH8521844.1 DUF2066 domain-containing protein [Glycocaulis sp.]
MIAKHSRLPAMPGSGLMAFITAMICAVIVSMPVMAQSVFIVSGIPVDERADTTTAAQHAAFRSGQLAAAKVLLERMTLPEDRINAGLVSIPSEVAQELVVGLQVADERRSANRYIATMTVEFDPRGVRSFLNSQGVAFTDAQAAPILVIPVTQRSDGAGLWGGAWYEAWRGAQYNHALTPFIGLGSRTEGEGYDERPLGRAVISASAALAGDEMALREIARLYGVRQVAVISARESEGTVRASGQVYDLSGEEIVSEPVEAMTGLGGYSELARRIVQTRQEDWKRQVIVRGGEAGELAVTVLYNSIGQWRALQRAITGASLVSNARLDAVSTTGAVMTLTYRGEREQLVRELAQRGARLEEERGLGWVARPRS